MKNYKILFVLCLIILSLSLSAQEFKVDWVVQIAGNHNDLGRRLRLDSLENSYFVLDSDSDYLTINQKNIYNDAYPNSTNVVVAKVNKSGELLWSTSIQCESGTLAYECEIDNNNDIIVAGDVVSSTNLKVNDIIIDTFANRTGNSLYIIKLNEEGKLINYQIFKSKFTISNIGGVVHDDNNNYYMAGYTTGAFCNSTCDSLYSLKKDFDKTLLIFKFNSGLELIKVDTLGSFGPGEIFDIKLDNENKLLVYSYYIGRSFSIDSITILNKCKIFNNGGYGLEELFITKLDTNLNVIWLKSIQGEKREFPSYQDITFDDEGNFYFGGLFSSDTLFFNTNIQLIRDNKSLDYFDIFYAKVSKDGEFLWAKKLVNGNDLIDDVSIHCLNNDTIIISGNYDKTSFNISPAKLDNKGQSDMFVLMANSSGDVFAAKSIGAEGYEYNSQITSHNSNIYFLSGFTSNELLVGDILVKNDTSNKTYDAILFKTSFDRLLDVKNLNKEITNEQLVLYPNPINKKNKLMLKIPNETFIYYSITDINSRELINNVEYYSTNGVDISSLVPGQYFIKIVSNNQSRVGKFEVIE